MVGAEENGPKVAFHVGPASRALDVVLLVELVVTGMLNEELFIDEVLADEDDLVVGGCDREVWDEVPGRDEVLVDELLDWEEPGRTSGVSPVLRASVRSNLFEIETF